MMQSNSPFIPGSQPITQTNKWCYTFRQNIRNAQISDVSDVKTAIILIEFLIDQNKINQTENIFND